MGKETFTTSKREILGEIARWAVRQSPYHRPDNLEVVLDKMNELIKDIVDYPEVDEQILKVLISRLKQIPEFVAWNERKNGNQSAYAFVDRYSEIEPDNDFIDLDALIRNVVHAIIINR